MPAKGAPILIPAGKMLDELFNKVIVPLKPKLVIAALVVSGSWRQISAERRRSLVMVVFIMENGSWAVSPNRATREGNLRGVNVSFEDMAIEGCGFSWARGIGRI